MNKKPRITDTRIIANSRLFTIQQVGLEFSNGEQRHYERIQAPGTGAVMVVPVTGEGDVILIREYAVGTDRYELLLPKGVIDEGESIVDAANREMMEEVGCGARRLDHINSVSIAPGYLSFTTHIVIATELYERRLPGDEPEQLATYHWPLAGLSELLAHEELTEARSIAALYLARDYLEQHG
jgi:ADP-ribose diphosphatase